MSASGAMALRAAATRQLVRDPATAAVPIPRRTMLSSVPPSLLGVMSYVTGAHRTSGCGPDPLALRQPDPVDEVAAHPLSRPPQGGSTQVEFDRRSPRP